MADYLKDSEEEIVSCLLTADVSALAEEMLQCGLVSQEDLVFLSHDMPNQQQIRYLLMQIYRQLREIERTGGTGFPALLEKCFELLCSHGVSTDLLGQVKSKYNHTSTRLVSNTEEKESNLNVSGLIFTNDGAVASPVGCGLKQQHTSSIFKEEHVSILTEILAKYSNKWNEIGISLHLPHNLLQKMLTTIHFHSGEVCLNNLLWEWVIKQHPHAKSPTVENLKVALRSNIVQLGTVANALERSLLEQGVHLEEAPPSTKRQCLETTPFDRRSMPVEGQMESTIVNPSSFHGQQFARQPVEGSSHTENMVSVPAAYTTIPSIPFVRQTRRPFVSTDFYRSSMNSYFNSEILNRSLNNDGLRYTPPTFERPSPEEAVEERTRISKCKKVLTDVYSAQPEVPEDSWPPVSNDVYINLALIKQSNANVENARSTIRKGMDDTFRNQESIGYENLFHDLKSGSRLLIEGRPGSGKSTLVHKVSRDWARDQLKLDNVGLLFLVRLRHFCSNPDITLHDLIKYHYSDQSTVNEIVKFAEEHSGEGLCFILDGLDEYTPEGQIQDTTIYKLIAKEILPKAIVIVASRPSGSAKVRKVATKQVETLGFLKDEIIEFVTKYKFSSPDKTQGLLSYLAHHPNVMHMCYLPIHTAMVCFLYNEMDSSLPRTETEMYKQFTNYTLLRTLYRGEFKKRICLNSVEDLPDKEKGIFIQICKLAFEKTKLSRHVMKGSEIKFFDQVSSDKDSLGLITVDYLAKVHGMENLYTFLHLTFQEYLAAYHIAHLDEEEQMNVINKHCNQKNMQVVWKFFCGLIDFSNQPTKFNQLLKFAHNNLLRAQYAFESQQSSTCSSVVLSEGSNRLSYYESFLNPTDFVAIGYVLGSSIHPVQELVLNKCEFRQEGVEAFLKEAGDEIHHIRTLSYHGGNCTLGAINKLLKNLSHLEILDITNTKLVAQEMEDFTHKLKLPRLRMLKLSENQCDFEILVSLSKICGSNLQCIRLYPLDSPIHQSLLDDILYIFGYQVLIHSISQFPCIHLLGYKLGHRGLDILATGIMERSQCTDLILTDCCIGDEEAIVLSKALRHTPKLHMFNVSFNSIGDEGAKALAEGLKHCPALKVLDLSCNEIGDEGAIAIAEATKSLMNLNCLIWNHRLTECSLKIFREVQNSSIVYSGIEVRNGEIATVLSNMIDNPNHYKGLDILKVKMSNNSIKLLAEGLKYCTNLQRLNLEENIISNDDVRILAEGIRHCSSLQILDFKSCSFASDGAKIIFESIRSCGALLELNFEENCIGIDGAIALAKCLICFSKIQTLKLDSNAVGDEGVIAIIESLKHCSNLQTLSLNNNHIKRTGMQIFAGELKHFRNLHSLHLENNNFSTPGALFLAEGLKHCRQLHTLNLSSNNIGCDGIEALAESLKQCHSLHTLHLDKNQIGVNGAKALSQSVKHCNNLNNLYLDWNDIDIDGTIAFADSLKYCNDLRILHFDGNFIGNNGAKALAESLTQFSNLHTLSLDKNEIGVDGATALAGSLKHCKCLQTLHLNGNEIGVDGAKALAESLNCNSLRALHMDENEIGVDGARALAESLKHCNNLHTLHLDSNFIRVDGMKTLANSLKYCVNLRNLHLDGNFIGADGTQALSESLKHCNNLHTLHLDWNEIGIDGTKALADSLKCCSELQTLHLVGNNMGADGAVALAESLKYCNYLHTLHLDGNEIGVNGVKALAKSLKYFNNLLTLCLDWNEIGIDGATALAYSLRRCVYLHTLHLDGNQIGIDGAKVLAENLVCCNNLHTLHLEGNEIGDDGAKCLARCLVNCNNLHTLNLAGNEIGKSGIQALTKSLIMWTS